MLRLRDMIVMAWDNKPAAIQQLINEEKVDGESDGGVNVADEFGHTPLMLACMTPAHDNVKTLIRNNAEINKVCIMGWNALMYSVYSDQPVHAKLLLEMGTDLTQVMHSGRTVFHLVAMDYKLKELELLLDYAEYQGVAEDLDLFPVMKQAMCENQFKVVSMLIDFINKNKTSS